MKQKTKKAVSKRFKLTKTGKVLRGHANSSHLKSKKSNSRLRRQKEPTEVKSKFRKRLKKILSA